MCTDIAKGMGNLLDKGFVLDSRPHYQELQACTYTACNEAIYYMYIVSYLLHLESTWPWYVYNQVSVT